MANRFEELIFNALVSTFQNDFSLLRPAECCVVVLRKNALLALRRRHFSFNKTRISRESCPIFFTEFHLQFHLNYLKIPRKNAHLSAKIHLLSLGMWQHSNVGTAFFLTTAVFNLVINTTLLKKHPENPDNTYLKRSPIFRMVSSFLRVLL